MPNHLTTALAAGLISAAVLLCVVALGLGFFFLYSASLPLFALGLTQGFRAARLAVLTAAVLLLLWNAAMALAYLLLIGLPVLYLVKRLLQPSASSFFPIGRIFCELIAYACFLLLLAGGYYADEPGGLPGLMSDMVTQALRNLPEEYATLTEQLSGALAFSVLSFTLWVWGLALYGHLWLACRLVRNRAPLQRDDIALRPFIMPRWMLGLLAIAALASLIGGETLAFVGKASLLSLLFGYFLAGLAWLHGISHRWQNRVFLLFFIYFWMIMLFWPAFILAGIALWHQLKSLAVRPGIG